MLDQSLIQSHFIGRDGFRWWIGQIPPLESMGKQIDGQGWGNRFKVRILGYHPYSEVDLPNEDLPWAQCLIPTTAGSGAANVSTGVQLQQGDIVLGFFLDGDNAQIPVILATFGRTDQVPSTDYRYPFDGFTGFSNPIKKNSKTTSTSESNEVKENSQRSPESISEEQAKQRSIETKQQIISENGAIGNLIPLANTVKNTQLDKIKSTVQNLIRKLKKYQGDIEKIKNDIRRAADSIVTLCNDFIGGIFEYLIYGDEEFKGLIGLLKEGLNLLYNLVYGQVLAATGNPIEAKAAGIAAQTAMVLPVRELEESFSCIVGSVLNELKGIVSDLLYSVLDNVDRFVSCAADQFAGTLLNSIIGSIELFMNGPLNGIEKILQFFSDFNLGNILREGIGLLSEFGVGFGCNQDLSNFKGLVNEWKIGSGPSGSTSTLVGSMVNTYNSIKGIADIVNSGVNIKDVQECFTDSLQYASPPVINIFGGLGSGCTAIPIFGNLIQRSDDKITASIIGIQVTNSGTGYKYPPFIEIIDDNDQGYGAIARSVLNQKGEVESIYIVSEGENYSVGNIEEYSVLNVLIEDGGADYKDAIVTDNLGNTYDYQIVDGRIDRVIPLNNIVESLPILNVASNTGSGAILRPVLGSPKFSGDIQTSIDCPI